LNNLANTISSFFKKHRLQTDQVYLLLAVSGGVDSVVMTDAAHSLGLICAVVHCNFKLRGNESMRDEAFVRQLAAHFGLPVEIKAFETSAFAERERLSTQVAARQLRYHWFEELVLEYGQKPEAHGRQVLVATAHHANDVAETMLFHFARGTGIEGLQGIPERQGFVIRPMLTLWRSQIEGYAKEHGLQWVEDSSNEQADYTRNKIRHRVLPALEEAVPRATAALVQNAVRLGEAAMLYREVVSRKLNKLAQPKGDEVHVPVLKLLKQEPLHTITWELIRPFGFTPEQVDEVLKLCSATTGSYIASASYRIIRNRAWLIIAPLAGGGATAIVVEKDTSNVAFSQGVLNISEREGGRPDTDKHVACIDAKMLRWPLLLRPWHPGDYLYPLGLDKKKKVARLLIDLKLSKTDKEKVWVLESEGRIVWVVGLRIDNRFRLSETTSKIIRLAFEPL
jgi:tRNA(Ile)-lysidine synthase